MNISREQRERLEKSETIVKRGENNVNRGENVHVVSNQHTLFHAAGL